ncbi:DUF4892 domain-containing protein [Cupriavidus basilensis]|uniref:DUF4892 domain-containing protein n=1 Tax=Cupriavidus basilensis TaxID=68895 RepID=A0ABT6B2H7_9BURK|nr:OmpA family protein [Cupriavidus basilensis]MDF3838929.1 DUF4892 domain-containing protein [Cupriavidus basilensis]
MKNRIVDVRARVAVSVLGLGLAGSVLAASLPDEPGSKDHPMLTRFAGAQIRAYQQVDYDEAILPNQPIATNHSPKTLALEGKITRIAYRIPGQKSVLEISRNYEAALQNGGFQTLFSCKGNDQCGPEFQSYVINGGKVRLAGQGDAAFNDGFRAILAKKATPKGDVYVFLDIMSDPSNNLSAIYQQVVETKAMQTGQVSVIDAKTMQTSIASTGKVAIYGVYFDTDKAEVKTESKPALDEMAKLLKADPKLKVYIVGHTDNQGALARNLDLSQKRADAVVQALTASYKIPAARLTAKGVGSLSPVASNDDDAGRGKNRRVELVKQ